MSLKQHIETKHIFRNIFDRGVDASQASLLKNALELKYIGKIFYLMHYL